MILSVEDVLSRWRALRNVVVTRHVRVTEVSYAIVTPGPLHRREMDDCTDAEPMAWHRMSEEIGWM